MTEREPQLAMSGGAAQTVHADTLGAFASAVSTSFVPLQVSTPRASRFAASLATAHADVVTFTEVAARPHLVERTPETIDRGGSGHYKVSLLLSGSSLLMQDGRELRMSAGDLTVYDTSRPYSLLFDQDFRNLILMFPKDRVELPTALTEQLAAAPLSQENPALSQVITAFVGQFPEHLLSLDQRVRAKLGRTALSLLGTLFSTVLDAQPEQRDPHRILIQRITEYIDEHLGSSELTPGSIAAAHFISTRHLHALFSELDTTVSTWIRERRLEHCRADLVDPVLADRTVSAIATRWGFPDAAHFSRLFKSTYGHSPSEIRGL